MNNSFYDAFALIGFIYTFKKTFNFSKLIKMYFLTKPKNFNSEYGSNCWVLITGSSQGIGKSFAKAFARENCNLILTSRNPATLQIVKDEIKSINPKVKVEYFLFDFSKINENYINELETILDKYEINIFINNVGISKFGNIESLSNENIMSMINTNLVSSTILSKILINKMKKRKNKSLIVTSGSDLTLYKPPYTQVYSGTKDYLKTFMSCVSQENENIDFTYLNIGPVYTPTNYKKIPFKMDSDEYVSKAMTQIGNYETSHGHYLHALKYKIFGSNLMMSLYTRNNLKEEFSKS